MPCDVEDHEGYHNWPEQGELRIWPCERACDYCTFQARDSSALRAHVRDVHQPGDFPLINILPGLNRPPVFNPALHGTSPRPRRQSTINGAQAGYQPMLNANDIDDVVQQAEEDAEEPMDDPPEEQKPTDDPDDDEYHDGPSSSAARGRKIQATPKAQAAAEEANARKRKRGNQRIPGEIFPARMPKTTQRSLIPYGPPRTMPGGGRGGLRPRGDLSPDEEDDLVSWFKSNINGMFHLGHAAGLSRRDIAVATQEVVNHWTFMELE
ncbi:hypothetical protein DIS24_g6226 [Lasiodiplodia hormozganensis]|uniref:Uncharacterized protein n=1 Tax=Lasiodiplodia hormozganensis TaxID=869390 RepID=A0AA40CVR6_9PEZI|nr:hypothetical protein DIS24_g6226 [Lasiodiplodia hormozganensis]